MIPQLMQYQVAEHLFRIETASDFYPPEALPSLTPFIVPLNTDGELLFQLKITDRRLGLTPNGLLCPGDISFDWEDARCIIHPMPGREHEIFLIPYSTRQVYFMQCRNGFRDCVAYLPMEDPAVEGHRPGTEASFAVNNFLMMLYAFNAARYDTLLMHASVIQSGGKGYLFLGKSGTGKSTHTSLWLKHVPGCRLLNDDNPIVRLDAQTGQATVYGSPWSGKTPCYLKESAPLGAFVRLEQAPQNEIEREDKVHAFAALLPSCSCLKQDKEIYDAIVSTVTRLATLCPVFHLKCLPDKEAALLCHDTVECA